MQEWEAKICDSGVPLSIRCERAKIEQLEYIGSGIAGLRIQYKLNDDDIGYKYLIVGPLPKSTVTGCEAKVIVKPNTLEGYAEDEARLWFGTSVDGNDIVPVDDDGAVRVNIIR